VSADDAVAAAVRAAVLRGATDHAQVVPSSAQPAAELDEEPPPRTPGETPQTAEQEADSHAARLEGSGRAPGEYLVLTRALEQEWQAEARKAGLPLRLSAFRCFAAGCYTRATHASPEDLEKLTTRFTESAGFRDWPGGKFRSGPITRGSEIEVMWGFFSEDPPRAAADGRGPE
jgi:hypothetical protein